VSAAENPLGFVALDGEPPGPKAVAEPEAAPFESIPAELREQDRWVVWRWEPVPERPDKPRKPPYRADAPDQLASSTNPETWASFEQAAAVWSVGRADGIGFALGPPYVGIDLDDELPEQEHGAIMLALDSYSERSPSGRGHHVIVKASLNGRGRHPAGIGVFQDARFLYFTGEHVQGTPARIEERQEQLDWVLAEYLKPEPRQLANGVDQFVPLDLDDQELLERAIAAGNGAAFRRLWDGDASGYPSRSEADLALCGMLAFWTGPDPGRIDRLFSHSRLARDKWRRRADYREHTLARALEGRTEFYAPCAPIRVAGATKSRGLPAVQNGAEAAAGQDEPSARPWLVDAADLLAEPDPGPTRYLVQDLIVDQALVAAVGRWKTTKTYGFLDIAISVRTGLSAFGAFEVCDPGPVVFVIEESGKAALRRRIDALLRGRAIEPERLRGLHVAANERVKLDNPEWQKRLIDAGQALRPRLFVFDPLARMKSPTREESAQAEMATVIEFLRLLRDETGAAVAFVHHTGHTGGHMRGSSDLESVWETRLTWTRDGQSPLVTVQAEHREAEAAEPIEYRIAWNALTRSMRFDLTTRPHVPALEERIATWLTEHRDQKTEDVATGLGVRKGDVFRTLVRMEAGTTHGTTHRGPSGRTDRLGRPIRDKVWNLTP
jgi:putative DNA primase/helicase